MAAQPRLGGPPSAAPRWPDCVPVLVDPGRGVRLRAHTEADLSCVVEQARDPETQRWTTVPVPPGGYTLEDARDFGLRMTPQAWETGTSYGWAIEADRDGRRAFCGSIDLRMNGDGVAELGFGLHPGARGRGVMSAAVRLVRDYALDDCGIRVLRWRALAGNWESRRVAARAGLRFDGRVRSLLEQRGQLRDGWVATLTAADPREPLSWPVEPHLAGDRVALRPFTPADLPRIAEACADARTQHWLVSLPRPYRLEHAAAYLESRRELTASGGGLTWCVAGPENDCLGCLSLEGFDDYSRRAEIGYWAHPAGRGRGMLTEAVRVVSDWAEASSTSTAILLRCAAGNRASRHVAESAGYRQIGVQPRCEPLGDGTLDDLVLYSRPGK